MCTVLRYSPCTATISDQVAAHSHTEMTLLSPPHHSSHLSELEYLYFLLLYTSLHFGFKPPDYQSTLSIQFMHVKIWTFTCTFDTSVHLIWHNSRVYWIFFTQARLLSAFYNTASNKCTEEFSAKCTLESKSTRSAVKCSMWLYYHI